MNIDLMDADDGSSEQPQPRKEQDARLATWLGPDELQSFHTLPPITPTTMTPPEQLRDTELIINDFFGNNFNYLDQAEGLKPKLQCAWVAEWLHAQSAKDIPGVRKEVWNELINALKKKDVVKASGIVSVDVLDPLFGRSESATGGEPSQAEDDVLLQSIAEKLGDEFGVKNPLVSPGQVLTPEQLEKAKEGFAATYRDTSGLVVRFQAYVTRILHDWKGNKIHSPHGAIVQSSGMGKSRLISEYAHQGGLVMYCCLREHDSTGYPPRTPEGIPDLLMHTGLLMNESGAVQLYFCYLVAILDVYDDLARKHKFSPAEWFQRHALLEYDTGDDTEKHPSTIWKLVRKHMEQLEKKIGSDRTKMKSLFDAALRRVGQPVMYVFDEARALSVTAGSGSPDITHLRYLRRALKLSPKSAEFGCCGMFLDTSSKVSTFLPTRERDPSMRYLATDSDLECPFYLIDTFDELAKAGNGLTLQSVDEFCHPDSLIRFGRPMWVTQATPEDVMAIAKYKLVCGTKPEWNMKQSLAVLGTRICLHIAPRTELASSLVGDHMRCCVFVSQARDFIWSVSPSEPVLVEAATQFMHQTVVSGSPPLSLMLKRHEEAGPPPLSLMLKYLKEALLTGFVEAGPRGELVARIILLLAADHACQMKGLDTEEPLRYARVLTVREYLSSLIGSDTLKTLTSPKPPKKQEPPKPSKKQKPSKSSKKQKPPETLELGYRMDESKLKSLLGGSMFFTHIVHARYRPKREDLLRFMARGAAVSCRRNEEGLDIIIPVLLPDQGMANPGAIDLIPNYKPRASAQTIIQSFTSLAPTVDRSAATLLAQQQQPADGRSVICIDPSRVSYILVQVKNYESGTSDGRGSVREYLRPAKCVAEVNDDDVPYVGIWMQMADIRGQAPGVQGIPLLGCATRNHTPEENMLGMITDGISTRTFPFLNNLPSMKQAGGGDRLDLILKDLLRSMPDPIEFNKPYEQVAVMKMMALEYEP